MKPIRTRATQIIAGGLLLLAPLLGAAQQAGGTAGLQQMLLAQYPPATTTPDGSDLVAPGTVVVLRKDNLATLVALNNLIQVNGQPAPTIPVSNTYVNGAIKQSGLTGFLAKMVMNGPGGNTQTQNRRFMTGEKLWVVRVQSANDGVTFTLLSDPINGMRYHAALKFPFPKDSIPPPEQVLATIAEALQNDSGTDQPAGAASVQNNSPPPAAAPEQTKTIAVGQTKSQVQAMFGAPARVAQLGGKEIDFYPDMKVTFVNSKVTDVSTDTQ